VTKPKLTIISEFGEELRGMRKAIVERIGKVLELKCLPGDIGLHIRLSDFSTSPTDLNSQQDFIYLFHFLP